MLAIKREALIQATEIFLREVSEAAVRDLGPRPERLQQSQWMIRDTPSSASSRTFERNVFDHTKVFYWFQMRMWNGFRTLDELRNLLEATGLPKAQVDFAWVVPLIENWFTEADTLAWEPSIVPNIIEPFVDMSLSQGAETVSLDAIASLPMADPLVSQAVHLEGGVTLRPVSEPELWEFGDRGAMRLHLSPIDDIPSSEWTILEVVAEHSRRHDGTAADSVRKAFFTTLPLFKPGYLRLVPLSRETRGALPGGGRWLPDGIGRALSNSAGPYALDAGDIARLRTEWPRLKEVLVSERHYLSLPAERLVNGVGRDRPRDAIIDFAIGLEALLLVGARDELKYRIGLRGATILAWDGGDKKAHFGALGQLYDVRSRIVHGERVPESDLHEKRKVAETALRSIWWWFYSGSYANADAGLRAVDARILG